MQIRHISEFTKGWFLGAFDPTILYAKNVEIGLHQYETGHVSDGHYHKSAIEINVVVKGFVKVNHVLIEDGGIWTTYPFENPKVEFLEKTDLIVIKIPSVPEDKYYYAVDPSKEQRDDCRDWGCIKEEFLFKAVN